MLPIRTVLHPTDFSDHSWHALQLACSLARDYKARLVLLTVVPPEPQLLLSGAREQLDRYADHCSGLATDQRVEVGDPADVILRLADEQHADVIVMGTRGRTGLRRLINGSVTEEVVRRASCPVFTIANPLPLKNAMDDTVEVPALAFA